MRLPAGGRSLCSCRHAFLKSRGRGEIAAPCADRQQASLMMRWQVVLPVEQTQFTEQVTPQCPSELLSLAPLPCQVSTTIPSHPTIRQPFKPRGDPGWRRVAGFRLRQRSTSRYCPHEEPRSPGCATMAWGLAEEAALRSAENGCPRDASRSSTNSSMIGRASKLGKGKSKEEQTPSDLLKPVWVIKPHLHIHLSRRAGAFLVGASTGCQGLVLTGGGSVWKNLVEAGRVVSPASPEELEGEHVPICLFYNQLARDKVMMLWVLASLLTLVEDVFSEEDNKESDLQHVLRLPSVSPAKDLDRGSRGHISWPGALGNSCKLRKLLLEFSQLPAHTEEWSLMQDGEIQQSRWRRAYRDPYLPRTSRRNRKKTKISHDCHLERKEMRVRDLGLGYDSDEIILFKYCVGTCQSSRKNYDLVVKALMENGSISGKKVSSHPCCRPTRYETVSFMDEQTTWQTIRWLSAANCSCFS
ncbi:hypothetical protein NQZ68_022542 [Dissostichus eleginoides]|nr:hypothetical protein NQZ68_022542 [Dissostichus eleginoides]